MKRGREDLSPSLLIMGRNTILELLKNKPENIKKIYLADEIKSKSSRYKDILALINQLNIVIEYKDKKSLDELVGSQSHQSFVALLKQREYKSLKELSGKFNQKNKSLILVLDSVVDPHNFGAILRSAECFGVDAVIWSKNRGVGVTPVVSKASVGASELLNLVPVNNLVTVIKELKKDGYWVVASNISDQSKVMSEFDFPEKIALVLGSEEKGVSRLVLEESDYQVKIQLSGKIQSLNVAQAAAVFLHSMNSYRHKS